MTSKRRSYRLSDRQRVFDEYRRCGQIVLAADLAGVNRRVAADWLIDAGIHTVRPRLTPDEIAEIRRLRWEERWGVRAVAQAMRRSESTVLYYTRRGTHHVETERQTAR